MIQELHNERTLIEECKQGNMNAFEAIYRHFQRPLYGYALRMLGQHQDAEDAIQMTFLKLYRGINKFRYKSKFSSYLFRILINVCHDLMHTRKRHISEDLALATKSSEQPNEIQVNLEKSIQKLPERMRECFILYAIEDFSQSDIAQMMQLSVGTVKAHIYQAKQKLRVWLLDDPDEVAHEL